MIKLFDSELKVMEIIWEKEPITAKEISIILNEAIGWNKNTTYTVINKLIKKGAVYREEPEFTCTAGIKKAQVQCEETRTLIDKLYHGSKKLFFASFLQNELLSKEELTELKKLIDEQEEKD